MLAGSVFPFSSEIILSAFLIKNPDDFFIPLIISSIANTMGGMTGYTLGYFAKWEWINKWFRISENRIISFVNKYRGILTLMAFISWLPIIGSIICVSLGFLKISVKKTALYMFIGKFLRYLLWAFLTVKVEQMYTSDIIG
ncbi:integral membrane protein [Ichthyobacterium seriolicida]|uniref:Integral membrane protein n=1 Tax=Ichthyobacterium seriolicida TaxID=242600 RepID=A0A1J1E1N2_9FLAO|nr:integral membrane protein [Ichthyobacterium seriolicida]